MTLRLTVMMAETSRTSRVGAPGEDMHRSDPHWSRPAILPQPGAPRQNNRPTHTGSCAPHVLHSALPCGLTLGRLFLPLHLPFLICKMGASGRSLPVPHCMDPAWGTPHPPNFMPPKGEVKCAPGLPRPHWAFCAVLCLVAQSCPTPCDSIDCSPPGFSVHRILQARILEWVAMPSSRGSSQPRDQTQVFCNAVGFFII